MRDRRFSQWITRRGRAGHLGDDAVLDVIVERLGDGETASTHARHAAACESCAALVSQRAGQFEAFSVAVRQAADHQIGADRLARQWDVIERRLHGQPGRVLRFPAPARPQRTQPRARRWVAVAAASGLVFGLAAGRWLGPVPAAQTTRTAWTSETGRPRVTPATLEPALADEHLLVEVDAALARALHQDFLVLDQLTPRGADVAARGRAGR